MEPWPWQPQYLNSVLNTPYYPEVSYSTRSSIVIYLWSSRKLELFSVYELFRCWTKILKIFPFFSSFRLCHFVLILRLTFFELLIHQKLSLCLSGLIFWIYG